MSDYKSEIRRVTSPALAPILELLPENSSFLKRRVREWGWEEHPLCIQEVAEAMHLTRRHHNALGLAANQVGLSYRMFVMGTDFAEFTCINPEVIKASDEHVFVNEGCLSFPGLLLRVPRPAVITARYFDLNGKLVESEFRDRFARCFLHELDHLNGITFDKKVSRLSLGMARKKRSKKF